MARKNTKDVSRRDFLRTAGVIAGGVAAGAIAGCEAVTKPTTMTGNTVKLVRDPGDAVAHSEVVTWAVDYLRNALNAKNIKLSEGDAPARDVMLIVAVQSAPGKLQAEGLSLVPAQIDGKPAIRATGADERGLAYALTELADRVMHGGDPRAALALDKPIFESPANKTRSVCRVFVSEEEDKPWYYDKAGWERYFDMLAVNRFNKFNLSLGLAYDFSTRVADAYFFFAYPFFMNVPGYNVRAIARGGKPLPETEQNKNLETLQFISREAARRGIHFQLGLWTHSIKWPATANYTLDGITPETQAPYSRDALHALLEACPDIKGVTIRTHGESGIPEGDISLWKTVFDGTKNLSGGRKVQIDLHAKGVTFEIIDTALATGNPVIVTPKFWAEHNGLPYIQASIREWELPKAADVGGLMSRSTGTRNHTRYGYGDLLLRDREYGLVHRVFPGTQRFLIWGDPVFARAYGKIWGFEGMDGVEFFEPLAFKGRQGTGLAKNRGCYADASLAPKWSDQMDKYEYTFRLWGRMTYNPDCDADVYRRLLRRDYGTAAPQIEEALGAASRILPMVTVAHSPSAAQANFWPEVYSNMSHYDDRNPTYGDDTPSPKDFGTVSSLDPQLFATTNDSADALLVGQGLGKVTVQEVAEQLDEWTNTATKALASAKGSGIAIQRAAIDITLLCAMGRFWAAKFRTGLFYAIFDKSGYEPARQAALTAYQAARDAMADAANRANGIYITDITFGEDRKIRGAWADRLAHIDDDMQGMKTATPRSRTATAAQAQQALARVQQTTSRPNAPAQKLNLHREYRPGVSFSVDLEIPPGRPVHDVKVWYRHTNQAEKYLSADMRSFLNEYGILIPPTDPATYMKSPYDVAYYFEFTFNDGQKAMYPGFKADYLGMPYLVAREA